ncbi:hypothetical protein QFZ75_008029 [Streptomyces sp. V3I8]|uniref:hypothetical protein n=1 Tax=Streptomyces sp. V3I8 TaxID=3042279 RepID=UPI00278BADCC|nr:hypothetical protein [Streptomyces sp. V3I8]MDQ1041527.1 hypothetical protein [Streptomyces sp. V3I8]
MADQPAPQHLADAPDAPVRILTDAGWETLPVPGERILAPADYLDAYRAEPRPDGMPEVLDALLRDAETSGEGTGRHADLHVPAEHLPALAATAYDQFMTWGDILKHHRATMTREQRESTAAAARAAFIVHHQAKRPGIRMRPLEQPLTPDA